MEEIAVRQSDVDEGVATHGQSLAAVGIVVLAVTLAVLPALVVAGIATQAITSIAVGLGSLAVVVGGAKLAAAALGALRFAASPHRRVSETSFD